jgi:hypothetical protein
MIVYYLFVHKQSVWKRKVSIIFIKNLKFKKTPKKQKKTFLVGFFGFFLGFFGWVFWVGFLMPTLVSIRTRIQHSTSLRIRIQGAKLMRIRTGFAVTQKIYFTNFLLYFKGAQAWDIRSLGFSWFHTLFQIKNRKKTRKGRDFNQAHKFRTHGFFGRILCHIFSLFSGMLATQLENRVNCEVRNGLAIGSPVSITSNK